jgi:YfiH family protein
MPDAPAPGAQRVPQADAAVTARPGTVLAVLTADCLPVLLCNVSGSVAGVAHAGWRGLAHGVLERTVEALARRSGDRRWIAWLGPAIGPCCFEVGDEVRQVFVAQDAAAAQAFAAGARPGKWQADLYTLARIWLAGCGVQSVHGGGACTACDSGRFYSYRRDRVTGRMASVAWLG